MKPISALMCVYNREEFLAEAIESILNQTFTDFEFVIVMDGATDRTLEIVNSYVNKDARIKVLIIENNTGITRATTRGLVECSGKYIALMDSDDISLPNRFQMQYDFLEDNPAIDALGSGFIFIDEEGNKNEKFVIRPSDPMVIRFTMFYRPAVHNPTVMARTAYLRKFNEDHAEESLIAIQDYAFFMRTNFDHLFSNLPDILLLYRLHSSQISQSEFAIHQTSLISAHLAFEKLIGKPIAIEVIEAFYFSARLTSTDARVVRQGMYVMFQAQKAFERSNPLTKHQVRETRTILYEKIKSYVIKYKKMRGVILIGIIYMLRLLPARIFSDGLGKLKKFTGNNKRSEVSDELFYR